MIKVELHQKPFGATSQRLLDTVTREMMPAYNSPGPFGEPPMSCTVYQLEHQLNVSILDIQTKAKKGMMMVSFFKVAPLAEENKVQVWKKNNEQEDALFFTITIE